MKGSDPFYENFSVFGSNVRKGEPFINHVGNEVETGLWFNRKTKMCVEERVEKDFTGFENDSLRPVSHLFNVGLAALLETFDEVYVGGEASSHCVRSSVNDYIDFILNSNYMLDREKMETLWKLRLLVDCMSPVEGFEQSESDFIMGAKMLRIGMTSAAALLGKTTHSHPKVPDNEYAPVEAEPDSGLRTALAAIPPTWADQTEKTPGDRPVNPHARTGLTGRSSLGQWGANWAADALVTFHDENAGKTYMALILREKEGIWAIPGGFVNPSEPTVDAARREFCEEAMADVFPTKPVNLQWMIGHLLRLVDATGDDELSETHFKAAGHRKFERKPVTNVISSVVADNASPAVLEEHVWHISELCVDDTPPFKYKQLVNEFVLTSDIVHRLKAIVRAFQSPMIPPIYRGYVNDTRNTDNSWMMTTVQHVHVNKLIKLSGGDDAVEADWFEVQWNEKEHTAKLLRASRPQEPPVQCKDLFASHGDFVIRMVERHPDIRNPLSSARTSPPDFVTVYTESLGRCVEKKDWCDTFLTIPFAKVIASIGDRTASSDREYLLNAANAWNKISADGEYDSFEFRVTSKNQFVLRITRGENLLPFEASVMCRRRIQTCIRDCFRVAQSRPPIEYLRELVNSPFAKLRPNVIKSAKASGLSTYEEYAQNQVMIAAQNKKMSCDMAIVGPAQPTSNTEEEKTESKSEML